MPAPSSASSHPRRFGFTLVEMLVVMAIVATLMSLLLVGLQAARRTSRATKEKSSLKQVYQAWQQYASTYDDAALPGYIEPSVQTNNWHVKYKAKDGSTVPAQYAASYPMRLLPYLDHSFDTLYGYMEQDDDDFFKATLPDGSVNTAGLDAMSLYPAFGYNGYYVGGYWRDSGGAANLRFQNAVWTNAAGTSIAGKVVATKANNMADPSRMVVFCGATTRSSGIYKKDGENDNGAALVVPHILASTTMWEATDGTDFSGVSTPGASALDLFPTLAQAFEVRLVQSAGAAMQVYATGDIGVPLRRFGTQISVVHGDGNVAGAGLGELLDQSRWMNPAFEAASRNTFTHSDPSN